MLNKQERHGGDVYRIARQIHIDPNKVLDFSGNINPLGIPVGLKEYIYLHLDEITHYPDMEYRQLREAIAEYAKCPVEYVMVGNGVTELIFLIMQSIRPQRVLVPFPTYGDYEKSIHQAGGELISYRIKEELDFKLDVDSLVSELNGNYDMLILCNPNNPTGQLVQGDDLKYLLDYTREHRIYVLLDETYIEFASDPDLASMAKEIVNYKNVIILRGFGKFFAIPGLRLGYCIANPSILSTMGKSKEAWTVNSVADMAGFYLLKDKDFIEKSRNWINTERPFLYKELAKFDEWKVYPSEASFFLIKIINGNFNAPMLKAYLEKQGILIRDLSNHYYLDKSFFRIAIRTRQENEVLLRHISDFIIRG